jgi:hypothetical protein
LFIEHCKAWHRNPDPTLELFNQKLRGNLLKIFMAKFLMFSQDDDSNLQRENSELIDKMKDINKMLEEMSSGEKMNPEAWLLFLKQQEESRKIQIGDDEGKDKTMIDILSKLKSLDRTMKLLKNNNIDTEEELLNKCKLSAIDICGKNKAIPTELEIKRENENSTKESEQQQHQQQQQQQQQQKQQQQSDPVTMMTRLRAKKTETLTDEATRKATKNEIEKTVKNTIVEKDTENANFKAHIKNLKTNHEKTQNISDEAIRNIVATKNELERTLTNTRVEKDTEIADLKAHNNILTKDLNNARADVINNLKKTKCVCDEVTRQLETTMKNTIVKDTEIADLKAQIKQLKDNLRKTDEVKRKLESQIINTIGIGIGANIKGEAKYQLVVAENSEMLRQAKIIVDEKSVIIESLLQQMAIKEKHQNEILTKLEHLEKKNNICQEANINIEAKYQLVVAEDSEKLRQAKISIDEKSVIIESLLQQMAIKEKNYF